jgi:hypothetical protein
MLLVFRGLWNDGTSASMYREIMLRNKSIFQVSTLTCLSSISICNLLIDLASYMFYVLNAGKTGYTYILRLYKPINVTHEHIPNYVLLRDIMDNEMQSCMHPVLPIKPHFTPLLSILHGTKMGIKFEYIKTYNRSVFWQRIRLNVQTCIQLHNIFTSEPQIQTVHFWKSHLPLCQLENWNWHGMYCSLPNAAVSWWV